MACSEMENQEALLLFNRCGYEVDGCGFSGNDSNCGLFRRQHLADFYRRNACLIEGLLQALGIGTGHRDEESARGLGVEENGANVVRHGVIEGNDAFREIAIGIEASGDVSGLNAFESAGKQRDARGEESQTDV